MELFENTCISDAQKEYLEAIYEISREKNSVRTTDIALKLGISKPSVNKAVGTLKRKGFVSHQPYGDISLTEAGSAVREYAGRKEQLIKAFLMSVLSLTDDEAEREACMMGNSVSASLAEKMNIYMNRGLLH